MNMKNTRVLITFKEKKGYKMCYIIQYIKKKIYKKLLSPIYKSNL